MRGLLDIPAQSLLDIKDQCIKGLALSLFLGMMVVFVLLIGAPRMRSVPSGTIPPTMREPGEVSFMKPFAEVL